MSDEPLNAIRVRPIDPLALEEVELVAARMGETLVEVLGEDVGGSMYTPEWLVARVRFHLDPTACLGEVFLAVTGESIIGHTIVRQEPSEGDFAGLFSTTYVTPDARRDGAARLLLDAGEDWMRAHGLTSSVTYTDPENAKLIELFTSRGYALVHVSHDFVQLSRRL